ncbi:putative membrane protein YphA (DoxX/SURF4 family) [Rhodopseudomonas rhenobacensis]|uniref:Putative membrane protein YphA (DoxX/SURF4 family) n=1 Tax=Rhodopseudomonas rhenobacensis TaxID=87461 RepID=A0A7W8DY37_9BRAD|nr:DoxX family protein [Rhodopseudomonas rhenobacensis]MBB5046430.1 putative membrane protein YphA (DoxX/SURF4 family) [Rhodopseudomonas rhenobacensis]
MPAFISFGRFLFAVLFIFSGAAKLLDIAATTEVVSKIAIPALLTPYTADLETMAGMTMPKMLAIAAGVTELLCGVMIAFNFAARYFALLLIVFVIVATYTQHDFWNQSGPEATNNMIHALKNLSLIGALLIIAGIGRGPRAVVAEPTYSDA